MTDFAKNQQADLSEAKTVSSLEQFNICGILRRSVPCRIVFTRGDLLGEFNNFDEPQIDRPQQLRCFRSRLHVMTF